MTDANDSSRPADLSGLTPEQRALLMLRMRQRSAQLPEGESPLVPLVPIVRDRELPLSFAQQRLWFLDQWQPRNPAWNISGASRLTGPLDVDALRWAFDEIVRRHESLRTSFVAVDGRPVQVVGPPEPLPEPLVDLSGLPEAVRDAEVGRLWQEELERPFDLGRDRLIRAALLRCSSEAHVSFVTMHHIVSDGWSLAVYIQEFAALYAAHSEGRPSPLPDLPVQYPDFAVWQREHLDGERLETLLGHWRRALAGAPTATELPVTRPWPAVRSGRGADELFAVPAEVAAELRALSRREGMTLFMTLLAALETLLHRYSGAEDLLVGSPVAGRNRAELEGLIGFFVNTLVLRADLAGDPPFRELLARTREVTLDAQAHQDIPFEKLVEELRPERDPLRPPLVQVVLSFQNTPSATLSLAGVELTFLDAPGRTARYDLLLSVSDVEGDLPGHFEYSTDLFDAPAVRRIAGHYGALLAGIAADPGRRLSELSLLTEEEGRQIVRESAPRPSFRSDVPLHRLFEAAAARNPAAVAISREGKETTYGELDEQASRLARRLRRLGVGPEVRVGLSAGRSPELITGLLGILKAGGAYVPLDPDLPAERLSFLREDSGVRVVLDEKDIKDFEDSKDDEPRSLESFDSSPDHAAYVIYTSGSTGRPKGVVVRHGEVARLLSATDSWFRFGPEDVWTLFHSYAFDFSVWEIWGALAFGGRLVIVPYAVSRSPEAFHALLARERVTVLNQTPSAFRQLVQWEREQREPAPLALREVIFGGEALELPMLAPWFERHGDQLPRLVNMYGITETTVHVTFRAIRRTDLSDLEGAAGSVIGEPIPDLSLWLLDRHGRPVADLVPGEIHVGGAGLARGYLGRPELTAERFIPDSFSGVPGSRLYRSGDLARRLPEGDLQYLGRSDDQVKIRGFRIELGEIEAALATHPAVAEAAVLVRGTSGEGKRLVAWVVARPETAISETFAAELRRFATERLPEAMVPSRFVWIDALPLTANGKLDRRSLSARGGALDVSSEVVSVAAEEYEAPATPAERILAEVWAEALGLERVGASDGFFALGGDSILSLRVLARAREKGLEISLQQLFQHPTLRDLAARLDTAEEEEGDAGPFSLLDPADRAALPPKLSDAYPLAHLQSGMLFHTELRPETAVYHDVFSAWVRAPFDAVRLRAEIQRAAARHPVLRTSFALSGYREPLQLVHEEVEVPFAVDDLRSLPEAERERAVLAWLEAERHRAFAWSRAPLARFQVHRRTADSFQLTLSFHHSVLDGWSAASLLAGLFRSYLGIPGEEAEAPPAGVFREYVRLERSAIASEEARAVWRGLLEDAEPCLVPRWPVSSRDPEAAADSRDLVVAIPDPTADGLRTVARSAGVPLKSVLLAAHVAVLARWTGRSDLLTGLVANGRPEMEGGDRALGLFLNTLPLRVRLGAETWEELAASLFALETRLLPHRRFPLADLQAMAGQGALFDMLFNFVHFHVYQGLSAVPDVEVLGWEGYEEIDSALGASFHVDPDGSRLDLRLSFLTSEIDARQAEALAGSYARALEDLAAHPGARAAEAPLLSAEELRQVLTEWSTGLPPDPDCHLSLPALFARQAAAGPRRVALVDAMGAEMTYADVEEWANRMARWLQTLGVGTETLVGVALEPSFERILLFLAILEAGGAYVPLDLTYPRERLARMVGEVRLPLLVAESRRTAELTFPGTRTVSLAASRDAIARQSPEPLPELSGRLAYVMFTSGSTGTPKAVGAEHRGVARLTLGEEGPDEVFLQFSPVSFDASTQEIWGALLNGGRLVLLPPGVPSLDELERSLRRHRVTILVIPPALFHQIAATQPEMLRGVTYVSVGGDVLSPEAVRRSLEAAPGCVISNGYGPTENTTHTSVWELRSPQEVTSPLPIGRPIPGTSVYLVDAAFQPVPAGVPGELVTGGDGLARGYLNRPDLTAERFVPDPFASAPGARLYRTGDRAAWRLDGVLQFLGRMDQQVKIRGFRIEPGEVEAHLSAHPDVAAAAVVVRDDLPGGRGLAAFVVSSPGSLKSLRSFLADRLPPYMIPTVFEVLPELPLTPVGKVDRRALLQVKLQFDLRQELPLAENAAPRDPVEETVAAIWREVLGIARLGRHDDFFVLGGSSLVAIQAVSRLRAVFGVEVPLRWLFDAPTVAALSGRLAGLLRAEPAHPAPPLVPRPAGSPRELPLSFAQERLWFVEQLMPGTATYNMATVARLAGALTFADIAALGRSLDALAERHESLRTRFPVSRASSAPIQIVDPPREGLLPVVDLTGLPAPFREETARTVAEIEALGPFDLEAGPLFRALLFRLAPDDHLALLSMHHIVSDGWSMEVLIRELTALYAAGGSPGQAGLAALPVQYADFALWQRGWLQGEVLEERFRFWRERLAGAPPVLALPLDRPRPPVQTFRGDRRELIYDPGLLDGLTTLARQGGGTLFMVLLAAFDALLLRLTGDRDVVVGVPSANRDRPEIEGLIGFFVNTLPLRIGVDPEANFSGLVERVREASLAAFAHADVPFEKLVAELRPERALSHSPVFQVLFQLLDLPVAERPAVELPGLTLRFPDVESQTSKFDLVVSFSRSPEGLFGEWRYGSDLFDGTTVLRAARQFEVLVRGILDDPDLPVADLPLLTAAERHQTVTEWNATAEEPRMATVAGLFARQAALTPQATAVVCDGKRLTYAALRGRVRRAARRLAARGVRPEQVVAVNAGRGIDFLTALLAILEAGGVYLPVDPQHPPVRLARILAQSRARWVLTEGHVELPRGGRKRPALETIGLDDLLAEGGRARETLPARIVPDHLAYVLFTSGSTGVPKGAMLTHRGMLNHLRAKILDLGLGPDDAVAQTAGQVFDISIWQHLAALLVGGRVHIFPDEVSRDPFRLLAAVEREKITVLEVVPSLLTGLLQVAGEPEERPELGALRWLISTGEALPAGLARDWRSAWPEVRLLNAYGPTECADRVSHAPLDGLLPGPQVSSIASIGRPIVSTRLHVLDDGMRPVPIGVLGELCVAGAGVGRGYLGEPARTAEVFVPDPFAATAGEPGARLYRTGDLARFRPDGTLEYAGRRDHQVKIRGVRIETGEIAAALAEHPAVRQAVVLARPQPDGSQALAAYLVARRAYDPADLLSFLRQRLPESMIPAAVVELTALPLTPNGKLDRGALPDPFSGRPEEAEESREAPRDALEELIAGLWREALGVSPGVHDDFFSLGGDSIKGAILIHRLQRRLGESLSVATLFGAPSIARLAAHIEEHHPRAAARLLGRTSTEAPADEPFAEAVLPVGRLMPIRREEAAGEPVPLSWSQERIWFLHQLDPQSAAWNMPLAFRLRGPVGGAVLSRFDGALREIARRHETLRTRFRTRDGRPEAVLEPPPDRLLAVADLASLPAGRREAEARRLVDGEAVRPFDLERGPVLRAFLVRLGEEDAATLFVSHHIACDGWSLGLWARELSTLYRGAALPRLPVQYSDFARWQRGWLRGEALEEQIAYWRGRLAGLPPSLDLPTDRPRPAVQTFRGASLPWLVPAQLTDALRSLARRQGASLFMALLAAFQLVLQRLSGQDDVAVGSPIAGRPQPEVEELIGCFLNTLVLRTDLSGRPTFEELLGRVRDTALGAYAHQDVPFEKLLEDLRPERDLSRSSLFQVLFNLLNFSGVGSTTRLDLPGLELEGFELPESLAKLDLTLYLAERENGLRLQLVWNADLFDRPRMEELLRQYVVLLEQIATGPGEVIDLYTLVSAEAWEVLPDPRDPLGRIWPGAVHDLFAREAQRRPDHEALVDPRGRWTYGELDLAVSRLAARLRADGIRPGDRVALWAHRGAPLVWAILGVLRTGAAFMILDPAYPEARLLTILQLARPHGFLRLDGAGALPPLVDAYLEAEPFLALHQIPAATAKAAVARFGAIPLPAAWPELHPEDTAAVSFTSGSTGVPKGIVQTHGSMSHFIPWHREVLGYGDADRHTLLSGLAHDPLQRDIFYALGTGATLCIPDPERIGEPGYLAAWMRRERVTVSNLTPAMAWLLTELPPGGLPVDLPDLRVAVLAGDVLTRRDVARVRRLAPRVRCVNVYGATESHRALSYHLVEEEGDERLHQVLPLGRGQRDVQLLVLGRSGGIAGIGEMGEIAIRSPHLAEGYLNDAEQTAQRFVPNPFTHEPGDRIYLTGDLGRYLQNGEVAAAGRADQQIKIRGFRVEPGEIEAELGRIAGVRESVVVGREDRESGERRLVAYVVLDPAASGNVDLRDRLRGRLPAYMVPSVFVPLDKLPLNPNGKVDRRALPAPEAVLPTGPARRRVPPRDHLELRLARIWEEVLGVSPVGVTDDFFELGGYSLLGATLLARIESEFGRTLPLAALFQHPTVEELAHRLRKGGEPEAEPALLRLQEGVLLEGEARPPFFLMHAAGGRALAYVELARALGPAWPVWSLQDVAPPDAPRTLSGMAEESLRHVRRVRPTGPYLLAGWSFGGRLAFEMARQLAAVGEEVAFVGMIDTGLAEPIGRQATDADLLAEQLAGELPLDPAELRREADPVAVVVARAQQAGLLPPDYPVEDARRQLQLFKAHLEVARTNRPEPYPGRVTFFAAEEQPELPAGAPDDPGHGWAAFAGRLEVLPVPGNHVTLLRDPRNLEVLAALLRGEIERALGIASIRAAVPQITAVP